MTIVEQLTVATWNLAGGRDGGGYPFDVVTACAGLDADVLALQETLTPDRSDLAVEVAGALGYAHVVTAGDPERRAHVALLSRLPLRRRSPIALAPTPGWCGPRWAARAVVDPDGWGVDATVVHLCHRPDAAGRQLRNLGRFLGTDGSPALLVGDFNLWGRAVRRLLPTWNAADTGPTWPARRPRHAIDRVLQHGLEVVAASVVDPGGSDHRAVRATLMRTMPSVPTTRPVSRPTAEGS